MNNNDNTDKQTPEMWRQDAVDEDADGDVADAADLGLLSDNSTIYIYIYIYTGWANKNRTPKRTLFFLFTCKWKLNWLLHVKEQSILSV